jgi:hypothetical protein
MQKRWFSVLVLLAMVALLPATALSVMSGTQVFFENFDGVLSGNLSGVTTVAGVQGFAGLGPAGNQFEGLFLHNSSTGQNAPATILTLTGLPPRSYIEINFLFGAIDSWDSTDGDYAPDYFNVWMDGYIIFRATFANASGTVNYKNGLLSSGSNLGFNPDYDDSAYNMYYFRQLAFRYHNASTVTLKFYASGGGWQGGADESWAIDNLEVRILPLPGTVLLFAFGLVGLLGWRFRVGKR